MSYLSQPRMVFSGRFFTDPSTVNNDPHHFDTEQFRSGYQQPGPGASNGWWNPNGSATFRLVDCSITRVVYSDGSVAVSPEEDPIVGQALTGSDGRVEGKLVDLDPEQQMVSQIWGLSMLLGANPIARSRFRVAPFAEIFVRYPEGGPDSFFSAYYQSILEGVEWDTGKIDGSRLINELGAGSPTDLSVKFNVDAYDDTRGSDTFNTGRIVGAIGPHTPGEPHHFTLGRRLDAPGGAGGMNPVAHAALAGNVLTVDVGNALTTAALGGSFADVGFMAVYAGDTMLGSIPYLDNGFYSQTAGIVDLELSAAQAAVAAAEPLSITTTPFGQSTSVLFCEAKDGRTVRADNFVYRLDHGETDTADLWATEFGRPLADTKISLAFDNTAVMGQQTQGPVPGPPAGTPEDAVVFPDSVTTDATGRAAVDLRGELVTNPRTYIPGQVYGLAYEIGDHVPPRPPQLSRTGSDLLNLLLWTKYDAPKEPTWIDDVAPILTQYAELYPVMKPIVDLGNFASVVEKRELLLNVFTSPVDDPNYMPVTRDLSTAKRNMLVSWLSEKEPRYMHLDSVEDLHKALQIAIELEHATLPPYLTAWYSIMPGRNVEVAQLFRSVIVEEMFHMASACNVLVALGGSPSIGHPGFVPNYPGSLPGGLRADLTVRLVPCSLDAINDIYMSIEQPSEVVETSGGVAGPGDPIDRSKYTIKWFYDHVIASIQRLNDEGKLEFGHADRQVQGNVGGHALTPITSAEEACASLQRIVHEGEGASLLDPDESSDSVELSHYYRFSEIVRGNRIVVSSDGFSYSGPSIRFDPDGVYPMSPDPITMLYPKGSRAAMLSAQFDRSYQAMLNRLHDAFNGEPSALGEAIGSMYSMSVQARQLMETPSGFDDGTTAGPAFQLPFPL